MSRYILLPILLLLGLILSACAGASSSQPTNPPANTPVQPAETSLPPTNTPIPPADTPIPPTASAPQVSFASDILPILESRCVNCHGGERVEEGLNLSTYANLMVGSTNGTMVFPGNADGSELARSVITMEMPKRGPKLTPAQIKLIVDWINQGALDN